MASGITIDEISQKLNLDKHSVKGYLEILKGEIKEEKLDLGNGKFDPYVLDLILIEREVDRGIDGLKAGLESVRRQKAA